MKKLDFSKYTYELELNAIVDGAHIGQKMLVDDEEYDYNRRFMNELGFKSDLVGWMNVCNIEESQFAKILQKAEEEKVKLRTIVDVTLHDDESIEWYILQDLPYIELNEKKIPGKDKYIDTVKGYKLRNHMYNTSGTCLISHKVKTLFEEISLKGYHVKWIVDSGRYASNPYYELYLEECIDGYFGGSVDQNIIKKSKKELLAFLEPFPNVASSIIEHYPKRIDVMMMSVPMIVNRSLLDGKDIIRVDNHYLVSRKVKECLVNCRLISASVFEPVLLCNDDEKFILFNDCSEYTKLHEALRKKNDFVEDTDVEQYRIQQYELYNNSVRPKYEITETMALRLLRMEKREYPQFFQKGVKKEETLKDAIGLLKSVYKISNGFYVGDEYQIYSVGERILAQKEFDCDYQKEQLTNAADNAKVIGKTADGEWLILLEDGKVVRYPMGEFTYVETWDSFWMFLEEAIES